MYPGFGAGRKKRASPLGSKCKREKKIQWEKYKFMVWEESRRTENPFNDFRTSSTQKSRISLGGNSPVGKE